MHEEERDVLRGDQENGLVWHGQVWFTNEKTIAVLGDK